MCGRCPIDKGIQGSRNYEMSLNIMRKGVNYDASAANSALATYSCRHKITKRPICAIPCNWQAEMCEEDEDEQCQGPPLAIILAFTCVASALFLCSAFVMDYVFHEKSQDSEQVEIEMGPIRTIDENDINRLYVYSHNLDFKSAIDLAEKYYNEMKSTADSVDEYFMGVLGTNELTVFFYDCVDKSIMMKIGSFFQRNMPILLHIITKFYLQEIWKVIKCILSMSIRYSDLPKDILFIYIVWLQLGNYDINSFPIAIFWILLLSILCTEILNGFAIIMYHSAPGRKKGITLLLTPAMPAYYMFKHLNLKLKLHKSCRQSNDTIVKDDIKEYELECNDLQLMNAKMQCTENILENLTQLTILIMMISLNNTRTRAVENIETLFVDTDATLGYSITVLSFFSMIRGQLTFLKACKSGCLSLTGTLIVSQYFILGTCSR